MALPLRQNVASKGTALLARYQRTGWLLTRAAALNVQRAAFSSSEIYAPEVVVAKSPIEFVEPPTLAQLHRVALQASLPMVGFGFMDQTLMIHAGNAIDCSIGVTFGLSTLAAAAVGQIVANSGGIVFGESLQRVFTRLTWIEPHSHQLSAAQLSLSSVERSRFAGSFFGLIAGCVLGLVNLAFIDTNRSSDLKMTKALAEEERKMKSVFDIDLDNKHAMSEKHRPATTITLRGPNVEGLLSKMLNALQQEGCTLLELSAKPQSNQKSARNEDGIYEDIFVIRRNGTAIPEDELGPLAQRLLEQQLDSIPRCLPCARKELLDNSPDQLDVHG